MIIKENYQTRYSTEKPLVIVYLCVPSEDCKKSVRCDSGGYTTDYWPGVPAVARDLPALALVERSEPSIAWKAAGAVACFS